jgi:hypothetical protein
MQCVGDDETTDGEGQNHECSAQKALEDRHELPLLAGIALQRAVARFSFSCPWHILTALPFLPQPIQPRQAEKADQRGQRCGALGDGLSAA